MPIRSMAAWTAAACLQASPSRLSRGGLLQAAGSASAAFRLIRGGPSIGGRQSSVAQAGDIVTDLKDAGLDCPIVGGAGTVALKAESGVYTELQVGSYLFMDADYARNDPPPPFAQSFFVLTTVTSTPRTGACWVDTGLRALAFDSGMPLVWNRPELTYAGASDEHGRLIAADGTQPVRLGERTRARKRRGNRVECLGPIAARGGIA